MSLRDELAQVLEQHNWAAIDDYLCGCGWEPADYTERDDTEDWERWAVEHAAHQADVVIAHLALTEQTAGHVCGIGCRIDSTHCPGHLTRQRRYVTPWENT